MPSAGLTPPVSLRSLLGPEAKLFRHTRRVLSEKRFIEIDGHRLIAVRCLSPFAARRTLELLAIAEAGGVPVQQRLRLSGAFTLRPFGWWHALQFVPGETWHRAPPNIVATRRLAVGLARLHQLRPDAGFMLGAAPGAVERTIVERATEAVRNSSGLGVEERAALLMFIQEARGALTPVEGYRLVHGDLHGLNIIVAPRGRVCFIDPDSMGAGLPLLELAHALLNLFGKRNAELKMVFVRNYLARLPPAYRMGWSENRVALLIFARLIMAWRRDRRSLVLRRRGDHEGAAAAAYFHEQFLSDSLRHLRQLRGAEARRALTSSPKD